MGSIIIIAIQVRDMRRNAEANTFMEIAKWFDDPTMILARKWLGSFQANPQSYEEVLRDQDAWTHLQKIIAFCETVGILVWYKRIPRDIIFDKAGPFIVNGYNTLRPLIIQRRDNDQNPTHAENFEILAMQFDEWESRTPRKLAKNHSKRPITRRWYIRSPRNPPNSPPE
jgi:hypothetical protein